MNRRLARLSFLYGIECLLMDMCRVLRVAALSSTVLASAACVIPRDSIASTFEPSIGGSCDFDMSGAKADTVFFVLGLLGNDAPRIIRDDDGDRLDYFYCDQEDVALVFKRNLTKLAREQGLELALAEERDVLGNDRLRGCPFYLRSTTIARKLNSCYAHRPSDEKGQNNNGQYHRVFRTSLSPSLFYRSGGGAITEQGLSEDAFFRQRALAYLAGAWKRSGYDKDFVFWNAKANFVAQLLVDLGCSRVSLETPVGTVGGGVAVHFTPTAEVSDWLHRAW